MYRTSFSTLQEREAEVVATMIMQRASVMERLDGPVGFPAVSRDGLAAVLANPASWL